MNKTKNKKTKRSIISLLLIAALIITGIFAFMTAKDSKTNVFTVGSVDIEVQEEHWDETDVDEDGIPDAAEGVMPGDLVPKDPRIDNTGANDAYVFAVVTIPTAAGADFYSMTEDGNVNIAAATKDITIKGYAFQKDCYDITDETANAADAIWEHYLGTADIYPEAVESDADRYELFYMATGTPDAYTDLSYDSAAPEHVWNDAWTQVGSVIMGEDGFNYYTFLYTPDEGTRLDAGASTDTIFDCVIVNENIGDSGIATVTIKFGDHSQQKITVPALQGNTGYSAADAKAVVAEHYGFASVDDVDTYFDLTVYEGASESATDSFATVVPDGEYTFEFTPNFALFNITIDGVGTKQYRLPAGSVSSVVDTPLSGSSKNVWDMAREIFDDETPANFNTTNYSVTGATGAAFGTIANEEPGAIAGQTYNITFTAA